MTVLILITLLAIIGYFVYRISGNREAKEKEPTPSKETATVHREHIYGREHVNRLREINSSRRVLNKHDEPIKDNDSDTSKSDDVGIFMLGYLITDQMMNQDSGTTHIDHGGGGSFGGGGSTDSWCGSSNDSGSSDSSSYDSSSSDSSSSNDY